MSNCLISLNRSLIQSQTKNKGEKSSKADLTCLHDIESGVSILDQAMTPMMLELFLNFVDVILATHVLIDAVAVSKNKKSPHLFDSIRNERVKCCYVYLALHLDNNTRKHKRWYLPYYKI